MKKGNNGNGKSGEKRVTCRNRRCGKRFVIKLGEKNDGYPRLMNCPHCGKPNIFRVTYKKSRELLYAIASM